MRQAIVSEADEWLRDHFELQFMYRHDSHVLDPEHPLPQGLARVLPGGRTGRGDQRP